MKLKLALPALLLGLFISLAAVADTLPTTSPESVGLSSKQLQVITDTLKADIAKGTIPGAVLLISRHGKIAYFEAMGTLDPEKKTPMTKDAIFRIYSMSKPITTVAAMILLEDGKLALSDPVAKYIPAFKDLKVGEEKTGTDGKPTIELIAPKRPMTVQDLMRHSSGLTYGFFGEGLVKKAYLDANLYEGIFDNAQFVERLSKLPLVYHPGTTWDYSHATDVLGRVVEVVSGKSLYQFEKENILDPLGMSDTGFSVPSAKQNLIAEPLSTDNKVVGTAPLSNPRLPTKWEAGGQGMVSTAFDYAKFLQMLQNGGALDGHRILSPTTVAFMTSDHLGQIGPGPTAYLPGPGYGFGIGFAVRQQAGVAANEGSVGDYYWAGAAGTSFWNDPKQHLTVVFMMQAPSQLSHYSALLRNMIYAALTEPEH